MHLKVRINKITGVEVQKGELLCGNTTILFEIKNAELFKIRNCGGLKEVQDKDGKNYFEGEFMSVGEN